jgi:UDP-N-acetylmuramoylalanine--D-glutamate ligase
MRLNDLLGKKIAILGFGIEGQAVADYLQDHNISFDVLDQKENPDYLKNLDAYDVVFRSAGVRLNQPEILAAKKRGTEITSQIKFFIGNCPAKIVGITGTKGKGTTSKLIYDMMQAAGMHAYLAGNIGVAAINLLDRLRETDYVVLELSSFQLQDLETSPHIAVVLMVVPEHLDYHSDVNEYVDAKNAITKFQKAEDFSVINSDYELSMKIGKLGSAKKYFIQTVDSDGAAKDPFTLYKPEEHLKIKDGIFVEQLHGNLYVVDSGHLNLFVEIKNFPLRGFHNTQNVAAAIQVAKILQIKDQVILDSIANFKGLEHRLELAVEREGVKFYNDSFGTTPESAIAAIKSFNEPEIVIIGGVDKKIDYTQFASELCKQKNLKALILIGEIAPKIEDLLKANGFSGKILSGAKSMPEVFAQIKENAEKGDVVLLAPASSSFGMFRDYKDRGEQFKKLANEF